MSEDSSKKSSAPVKENGAKINWGPQAAIIMTVVIFMASQLLIGAMLGVIFGSLNWSSTQVDDWLNTTIAQFIIGLASAAASMLVLKIFLDARKSGFRAIGLSRWPNKKDAIFFALGFLVYFGLLIIAVSIASKVGVDTQQQQEVGFDNAKSTKDMLYLVFISLVVLPPVVEEILFRGFLFGGLRTKLNFVVATIITSLLFAAPHLLGTTSGLLWVAAIDTFVLSLVLCYVREKNRSALGQYGYTCP